MDFSRDGRSRGLIRMCGKSLSLALGLLVLLPAWGHEPRPARDQMTDVWVRAVGGVDLPDISNVTPAGQAVMDAYDHLTDDIQRCLMDWGRVNTVARFPMELIVVENQVTILYEYNHTVRRVYLDQTEFPDDYPPSLVGYSIGRWEGDTLVVETRNLLPGWINMEGVAPYSGAAVATERFTLDPEQQVLTVERTVTDPDYYSGPVTWTTVYTPSEFPIYPYDCTVGSYGSNPEG